MKPALCDLALPDGDLLGLLPQVRAMGFLGIEVAPERLAEGGEPGAAGIAAFRRATEAAGLAVVGLHALLEQRPELGLFQGEEAGERTLDHLVRLSAICRDLGGRTLVLGHGRRRGALPVRDAWLSCRAFLERLLPRIEAHGTVLCFAPMGADGTDFCATAAECRLLADALEHPAFGLQMNAAAQALNGDTGHVPFNAVRGRLELFAVNEPGMAELRSSGRVDHADVACHLASIAYRGWLTLQQRTTLGALDRLERSAAILSAHYLGPDKHRFVPPPRLHSAGQQLRAP